MTQAQPNHDLVEALRRSASVIQELKTKLATYREPIAMVGAACRFPGANTLEEYWTLLRDGVDKVTEIPPNRWDVNAYYDPEPGVPGKTYVRHGGFLDQIDQFDAQFFNISAQEANYMDPQQRLLLETSWEALERAGLPPEKVQGSRTGVFIGISTTDYLLMQRDLGITHQLAYSGTGITFAAGRLAYTLGIQGPTVALDAACASSLVALHLACQSLRSGECDLALAGGVNVILLPDGIIGASQTLTFAADGRCKTFDAAADGTTRSEGCAVVALKRLTDARRDQDPILAVIHGTAMNHGGASSGITVPNKLAQEELLRAALHNGRIAPHEVSYVEAHGVGTPLGDPIEMRALAAVFDVPERTEPLWIGSAKTNIGHTEAAAGFAGLLKVVLALQHGEIPPNLHFHALNPYLSQEAQILRVPQARVPWPVSPKIAGVSAFGFSGANAHVIVGEAPAVATQDAAAENGIPAPQAACPERLWHLLTLSAKSQPALLALAQRYNIFLANHPETDLGDLCYTTQVGRSHFEHRLSMAAASTPMLQEQLSALATDFLPPGVRMGTAPRRQTKPKIAFLFSGLGSQYVNMGRELYETQPIVRQTLDCCAEIYQAYVGQPLLSAIFADDQTPVTQKPRGTRPITPAPTTAPMLAAQPAALFALECALAALWKAWGVEPAILMGHSLGEYAAACTAGVFSLEDGMRLVIERTRLLQSLPLAATGTAVVMTTQTRLQSVWEAHCTTPGMADVAIAAVNAPNMLLISGPLIALETIAEALRGQRMHVKVLNIPAAAHSPLLEPILDDFERFARAIQFSLPQTPLISGMTGQLGNAEFTDPVYWRGHLRYPVQFARGVGSLFDQGYEIFLEVGPKPDLLVMARQNADYWGREANTADGSNGAAKADTEVIIHPPSPPSTGRGTVPSPDPGRAREGAERLHDWMAPRLPRAPLWLPTLRQGRSDWQQIIETLGELYGGGVDVDWVGYHKDQARRKLVLPTYPFQRHRYWVDQSMGHQSVNGTVPGPHFVPQPQPNAAVTPEQGNRVEAATLPVRQQLTLTSTPERPALVLTYVQSAIAGLVGLAAPEEVNPTTGLIEAGIDSLMAMELRNRLLSDLGIKLALADFLQNPTVAGLTQQVVERLPPVASQHTISPRTNNNTCVMSTAPSLYITTTPLAPLQSKGVKQPFFCVHPWAGVVYPYLELARALGAERPFYGIQAAGLYGEPDRTIEEMAARYIAAIQSVQPTGPYRLGGWSSGGVIAFEMAQQLTRAGESVALLAIFDAVSSSTMTDSATFLLTGASRYLLPYLNLYLKLNATPNGQTPHLNENAKSGNQVNRDNQAPNIVIQKNFVHNLSAGINPAPESEKRAQKAPEALGDKIYLDNYSNEKNRGEKQFRLLKTLWQDICATTEHTSMGKAIYRVLTASARALSHYKVQPYPGQITLFRSQNQFTFWPQDETLGWCKVGKCQVISIPGHHFSMLQTPNVAILATRLQACLNADR